MTPALPFSRRHLVWALSIPAVAGSLTAAVARPVAARAAGAADGPVACAPRVTAARWVAPSAAGSSPIAISWLWAPPPGMAAASFRFLVVDRANPDPSSGQAEDPRSVTAPGRRGTAPTLNTYPPTPHTVAVLVSAPGMACDGVRSAAAEVTADGGQADPVTPSAGAAAPAAPRLAPAGVPALKAGSAGAGAPASALAGGTRPAAAPAGGQACAGPLCVPDVGGALEGAIIAALTTLLTNLIASLTGVLRSIIDWATAGGACGNQPGSTYNVLSGTPACLTWTNPYVLQYASVCRAIANACVALLICVYGLEIALATRAARTFEGALDGLRRVALAAVLANLCLGWSGGDGLFGLLLTLANAMTAAVASGTPLAPVPGAAGDLVQNALLALVQAVMEVILIVQLLLRLALLDLLLVLAPLALLCYAHPRSERWSALWAHLMTSAVLLQFLQVLALQLGGKMIASLDTSGAADASRAVVQTLLGIAGLVLVVRLPRLLSPLGGVLSGPSLATMAGALSGRLPSSPSGSGSAGGGTGQTSVTPEPGGAAGGLPALPAGGGVGGGGSGGGPLYPGGGSSLAPYGAGASAAYGGDPAGGGDDGPWGWVSITEESPLALDSVPLQLGSSPPAALPAGPADGGQGGAA